MKTSLYLFVLLIFLGSCNNNTGSGFTVEGKLNGAAGQTVFLNLLTENDFMTLDSAIVDEEGNFLLGGNISGKEFFMLKLSETNFLYLLIDSLDHIFINAQAGDLLMTAKIDSSDDSGLLLELNRHNYRTRMRVDSLSMAYQRLQNSVNIDSLRRAMDSIYTTIFFNEKKYITGFIEKNSSSLAAYMALYQKISPKYFIVDPMAHPEDLQYFKMIDSTLNNKYPESFHVKSLHSQIIELERRIQSYAPATSSLQDGSPAPDIAEPTPEGDTLRLSSLRGNYVLLDFWASWCKPCRAENPNLVASYKKYHKKGFEIFQVSLDKDKSAWIKGIADDKLDWYHVSDLKMWGCYAAKIYGVTGVPMNFLIDPEGNIIERNLRGPALEQKLSEIFK